MHSRYYEFYVTKNISSIICWRLLKENWLKKYGFPEKIICVRGRQFILQFFQTKLAKGKTKTKYTAPYFSYGNEIVESMNKKILSTIKTTSEKILRKY